MKGVVEEYSKLCTALSQMIERLPRIELYTETFMTSGLVRDSVNQFYVSILRFWTRACKFYSRHRLWNFVRVVWNDHEVEFSELQSEMTRSSAQVESRRPSQITDESTLIRMEVLHLLSTLANQKLQEISRNLSIRD